MIVGYNFNNEPSPPVFIPASEARSERPPNEESLLLSVSGKMTVVARKLSCNIKLIPILKTVETPTMIRMSLRFDHTAPSSAKTSILLSVSSVTFISSVDIIFFQGDRHRYDDGQLQSLNIHYFFVTAQQ